MKRRYLDENESALVKKCLVIINKIKKALSGETYREYLREHPDRISLKNISFSGLESALAAALSVKTVKDADRAVRAYLSLRRERDEIRDEIQHAVPQLRGNVVAIRLLYALLSVLGVLLNSLKTKIEIEEYMRKNKKDSSSRIADAYFVRAVRRNDGIKDLILKIKQKATELYNQFKKLPTGIKMAKILLDIIKAVSVLSLAKTPFEIKHTIQHVKMMASEAENELDLVSAYIGGAIGGVAFHGVHTLIKLLGVLVTSVGEDYIKSKYLAEN